MSKLAKKGVESKTPQVVEEVATKPLPPAHYLAVFDFDYTIVDENSDTVVRDLLPEHKVPEELIDIVDTAGWTQYMSAIFRMLHKNKFTPKQIREAVRKMPEVRGFTRLLRRLHKTNEFHMIIISDSNSLFIEEWLRVHGLVQYFAEIFTNPANFDTNGMLILQPYQQQTSCKLSARNLCKGKILENFLKERLAKFSQGYERIFYVGDGDNGLCAALRLRSSDVVFARAKFAMDAYFKNPEKLKKLRAELVTWINGYDLLDKLMSYVENRNAKIEYQKVDLSRFVDGI